MAGYKGVAGAPGAQGEDGEDGTNGNPGADGATGFTGIQGTASTEQGPAGGPGEKGMAGAPGSAGAKGYQGPTGFSGPVNDGTPGIPGAPGIKGTLWRGRQDFFVACLAWWWFTVLFGCDAMHLAVVSPSSPSLSLSSIANQQDERIQPIPTLRRVHCARFCLQVRRGLQEPRVSTGQWVQKAKQVAKAT